jgi:mevalonate kinase
MKHVSFSAPGKIILSGEHSVGYGKPALVSAVHLKLTASLQDSSSSMIDPEIEKAVLLIEEIVIAFLRKDDAIKKRPFKLSIFSDVPQGRGMGSSAAFCVAVVGALLGFYSSNKFDKQTINSLAYKAETFFHGMPSGVDVSASCYGGLIFYRKEFEFLKQISALPFKIPKNIQEHLILIDSDKPTESTSEMITHVGKRYNSDPQMMEKTFIEIEKCTKRMVISLVKEDPQLFLDTLQENEKLIENMGIVSEKTKKFLEALADYGVGKVTGAGGIRNGSGMIIFSAVDKKSLKKHLSSLNLWHTDFVQDFDGGILL